jgi:SAM-dependent methyltransferase
VTEDASAYGDRIAEIYDERLPPAGEDEIGFLAALAAGGRALELGIGTGRVAVPLADRGVEVHGIEASAALVERLRAKPGAERIAVALADFREVEPDGDFSLVYAVADTFAMLATQEEQLACVGRVASHLATGGSFVVEGRNPAQLLNVQPARLLSSEGDEAWLALTRHDAAEQSYEQVQVVLSAAGTRLYPVRGRYVWPAELDLMARLAGLEPAGRWGGWDRSRLTSASPRFVAVYSRG